VAKVPVKTYFWGGRPNFGDALTGLLLTRFLRLDSEWADPKNAELVMVGSILERLPKDWGGVVAGAGKLHAKSKVSLLSANILAVRGPLTAKGLKGDFVLADPGLLADEVVQIEDKQYDLGVVPHWTDATLEARFRQYNPRIIRVGGDPLEVIREIGRCKKIVSSSLHGIILADAFGIPRRVEISPRALSHEHQEGGLFKWHDYSASLGLRLQIGITEQVDRNVVMEKQYQLFDVFEEVKAIFARR
jgi:pyruvyltransferase